MNDRLLLTLLIAILSASFSSAGESLADLLRSDARAIQDDGFSQAEEKAERNTGNLPLPPVGFAETDVVDEVAAARVATTNLEITNILDIMERLFAGGNYLAVRQISDALLNDNPAFRSLPPAVIHDRDFAELYAAARQIRQQQRELTRFYHACALLETALLSGHGRGAKNLLTQAADEFVRLGDNFWQFEDPRRRAVSYHYAGRCYDYLTDYPRAIYYFRRVQQSEPSIELSIETSMHLARALQEQAEIVGDRGLVRSPQDLTLTGDDQKKRADWLKEAEQELMKITSLFSPDMKSSEVELMLIELRYRLGAFGDVEYQANDFLKRANPGTDDYAQASYLLAQAVYQQGDLARAAEYFNLALAQKVANSKLRGELFFGQGKVNMRLAETAAVEMRQTYLVRAETALRQATQLLPFGNQWEAAVQEFARVLLDLHEYREADAVLKELLEQPQAAQQVTVYYYGGLAARGLGDYERAEKYLHTVIELCSARGRDLRIALQSMMTLAALQSTQQMTAEAFAYYRAAEYAAEHLREYDLYAEAHLGGVLAQAELTDYSEEKRFAAGWRFGNSLLDLISAANSAASVALQSSAQLVSFRARALRRWNDASEENLAAALNSLQQLRGRLLTRLREDEVEYIEGKIVYWQARLKHKKLVVGAQMKEEDFQPVFALYRRAEDIIDRSIAVNPRGTFAAAAHYLLGEILCAASRLHSDIAQEWRGHGRHSDALVFESDSQQERLFATEKLRVAITTAENDTGLRVAARTLLGETYLSLADKEHSHYYNDGLKELRILVNEPSITTEQRIAVIRGIASALTGGEQYDEALRLLLAQSSGDLPSALQAMKLQLLLGQPRAAYRTLKESIDNAAADNPYLVEAQFELANLSLKRAAQIVAAESEIEPFSENAVQMLADLAGRYAGSSWASLSLLALGNYLIENHRYEKALEYADTALSSGSRAILTTQALYLLKGRALLAWAQANPSGNDLLREAREAFVRAERANIGENPLGRQQRAMAIYEQGNVAQAGGDDETALRYYGRVFAIFYQEYEPADLARLQAALIQEKRGNYEIAWKILDQGFDQAKLLTAKLRLRGLLDKEKKNN